MYNNQHDVHPPSSLQVALSSFGRVVFVSRYPAMLGVAVETMRYMVSLRGWNGIALPLLHAVGIPPPTPHRSCLLILARPFPRETCLSSLKTLDRISS